jgi:galactokinase
MISALHQKTAALFTLEYGGTPDVVTAAPGRVNLIGEHTDYNDGFVLPMAIDRHTLVAARQRKDGVVRVISGDMRGVRSSFTVGSGPVHAGPEAWSNYVRGMVALLPSQGISVTGADIAIAGNMPQGAGLSSSAALENAVGLALAALAGQADFDRTLLARIGQRTEHDFAGCQCGIMDQLASAAAESGKALLIDCRDLSMQAVPLPADVAVMIVHSGVVRGLVDGEYNLRRKQCAAAARHFGVTSLRELALDRLTGAEAELLDVIARRRAHHVVTENDRTRAMADVLHRADLRLCGQLMAQSHQSMRDDFSITVPAVDRLVSLLHDVIGEEGGARMTGGGFGGAVVALLPAAQVESVTNAVRQSYLTPSGEAADVMVVQPSQGVACLPPNW